MKITKQGNYLIITSYPIKLAWFCLVIIFASLYAGLSQIVEPLPILLGVTIPTVILFLFDFKLTIFDFNNNEVLQTNYSIKGKRGLTLPFEKISNIDHSNSLGLGEHGSCVKIVTNNDEFDVTTVSDASVDEQRDLISQLKWMLKIG